MDRYSYTPPPGGLEVEEPRSTSDFPRKIAAYYFFALTAYAHYLSLTSASYRYTFEAVQFIIFLFFPLLPVVQFYNNAAKVVIAFVTNDKAQSSEHKILLAAAGGMRTEYDSDLRASYRLLDIDPADLERKPQDHKSWKYVARMVFLLANATVSALSVAAYVRRLGITFNNVRYVGALGLDHRMGWLIIGGLTSVVSSLPVQLLNTCWSLRPMVTAPTVNYRLELCFETAIAAFIQDQLQSRINRPSVNRSLRYYLLYRIEMLFFWIIAIPLIALNFRRRQFRFLLYSIGILFLLAVAVVQLTYDILEIEDIDAGRYQSWNYRWAVGDPSWWSI
ncbi:hypothetical protein MMC19_006277 [Ptychographa xylographoides]|nr:hypothetical protein [Ptychographa xylographoides]